MTWPRGRARLAMVCLATSAVQVVSVDGATPRTGLPLPANDLRAEHMPCPTIVGVPQPIFSWKLLHPSRGASQSAYHVVVAAVEGGKVLWDSGVVSSNATVGVRTPMQLYVHPLAAAACMALAFCMLHCTLANPTVARHVVSHMSS